VGTQQGGSAPGVGWIRRRTPLLAATALAVGLALPAAGPTAASAPADPSVSAERFVVRARAGQLTELLTALHGRGVTVERTLGIIDGAVVSASPSSVPALRRLPSVAAVTPDAQLTTTSSTYDPVTDADSAYNAAVLIGAPNAWAAGHRGQGIDVALIDTGVAPVGPLADPSTVLNGPDLSFDSQSVNTRYLDANGHGTFMAGLIAGRATSTAPGAYQGIAPDARIVNVKVGDALGRADVSQLIAGIDWVVQHAQDDGLNIRVLNLSFGTNSAQSYAIDPLAHAAEVAWRRGIVVVASAGNVPTATLAMPAADPYLLAVGAWDSRATLTRADDKVAWFSATGSTARPVDVLAPGTRIQGLRVPGSYVDSVLGSLGGINAEYLRGSGTSQSAAITSGAAAVLLSARPQLTPDQVKKMLALGPWLPGTKNSTVGRTLSVDKAISVRAGGWVQSAAKGTGKGSLEASRGLYHVTDGTSVLVGERDIFGHPVDTTALAAARETTGTWNGGTWNGATWAGASWAGASWAGASWAGATWSSTSWSGASWAGVTWSGATWTGASWTGATWADEAWAGATWATAGWS